MALNAGTVQAFATLNDQGFESGINNLKKKGERFSKDMQKSFDKIGSNLTSLGSKMTMSITAPLLGAGALAVKTAADYEKLQIQINTLSGSAEKGAKIFKDLQEFSAGTPFQLGDLAKANNILVGMGQSTDDAFSNLKMLGDVASATGANINELAVTFGQASAEGKLMTRDIREFINRGIPLTTLLADSMGVAKDQIFDLASQGKISFDVLQKALEDATTGTGIYAGATEKAANSIGGIWSTLRDNISRITADIGNTIVEELGLKDIMRDMITSIQEGIKWFGTLDSQTKKLGLTLAGLAVALGPVILGLGIMSTAIAAISGPVLAVVAGIGFAATMIIKNWDGIVKYFRSGDGAKIWTELKELVQNTVSIVKRLWDVFGGDIMRITKDTFGVIVEVVEASLSKINNAVKFWANIFNGDIKGALGVAVDDFKNSFSTIGDIAKAVGKLSWSVQPLRIWASTVRNIFSDAKDDAKTFVMDYSNIVGDPFNQASEGVWRFGQNAKASGEQTAIASESVNTLTASYQRLSVAVKKVNDTPIFSPDEVDRIYRIRESVEGLYTPLTQLLAIPFNIAEKMAPPGSFGYLQESLMNLQEQLRIATDPEVIEQLLIKIKELKGEIADFQSQAEEGGQAMMGLANSIGNMFSQAVLHGQKLEDVVKNLLKQLASKAFISGISMLLGGGVKEGSTFLKTLFGGMFHSGGVVPGSGDKMIRAQGGEMVLTRSQQKALSMGAVSSGGGISEYQMERAFSRAMSKHIRGVSDRKIFEMAQQGRVS